MNKLRIITGLVIFVLTTQLFSQRDVNYDETKVPNYILPESLIGSDGEKITNVEEWEKIRRPELMELFATQVYGRTRSDKIDVTYELLTENSKALNGKATSKQVKFIFSNGKKKIEAILLIYIPNEPRGKVPVFVGYNFKGNHTTTLDSTILYSPIFNLIKDPVLERGAQSNRWPFDKIIERGYAVATMCYHDIFPDMEGLKDHSIVSLFPGYDSESTAPDEWQAIGAWAWGSSRIVDFLETQERIDADNIAIMGHSRQGKAALWAGAQDERFRVVISNDSGCGGAALSRRKFGETISIINNAFPHWFCKNFRQYNNNEDSLPVDQHQLLALIAPRNVYVASAYQDLWADPKGEFLSAYYAGVVYQLYGLHPIKTDKMPELHQPIMEDIGYHIRAGVHDVIDYDWKCFMDFTDKHFKD